MGTLIDLAALWLLLQIIGMALGFIMAVGIVGYIVVDTLWKGRR